MSTLLYIADLSPACDGLRARLESERDDITVLNVSQRPELIPELLKLTDGRRIVPVLVDGAQVRIAPHGGDAF